MLHWFVFFITQAIMLVVIGRFAVRFRLKLLVYFSLCCLIGTPIALVMAQISLQIYPRITPIQQAQFDQWFLQDDGLQKLSQNKPKLKEELLQKTTLYFNNNENKKAEQLAFYTYIEHVDAYLLSARQQDIHHYLKQWLSVMNAYDPCQSSNIKDEALLQNVGLAAKHVILNANLERDEIIRIDPHLWRAFAAQIQDRIKNQPQCRQKKLVLTHLLSFSPESAAHLYKTMVRQQEQQGVNR